MLWIKRTFMKSLKVWIATTLIGVIMLLLSPWFYNIWIGDALTIPFGVSFSVFAYFCFLNLNSCASYLLNGLNIIYIQLISSIFVTILYLLIVFPMGKYFYIEGVSWSMCLCFVILSFVRLLQVKKVLNGSASGYWLK
jgi:O-antigen/teichoic acid export membrane protein